MPSSTSAARREFLKFLAASPYVAALGGVGAFLEQRGLAQPAQALSDVIASPAEESKYNLTDWWRDPNKATRVIQEYVKYPYYLLAGQF